MKLERSVNLDALSSYDRDNSKRAYAVRCCELWCPSVAGDKYHDFVTQERHVWGGYSSCADQWNALPWMMGCTSPTLLNRADHETGLSWRAGVNISKTFSGARNLGCWVGYTPGANPQPGDMLLMGDFSKGEMEHVCVVEALVDGKLYSFDYGQRAGNQAASKRVVREWKGGRLYSASGTSRAILGWIDITKVPLDRNAVDLDVFA